MYNSVKNVFVAFNTKPGTQKNKDSQENSSASVEKKDKSSENYTKIKFLNDRSYQSRLLLAALDTWKSNKIFGNGIKSFRIDCYMLQSRDLLDESSIYKEYNLAEEYAETRKNRLCSNHPHNYYFEILTEVGILGLLVILAIGLLFVFFVLKNFKSFNKNSMENYILLAAIISLILEAFPLRSSGSVFSTSNATYIVLIASLILSYRKKLIKNN